MRYEDNNREICFKKAVVLGWKNLINFRGKASRSEHWWWVLFVALFIFVLMIVVAVISFLYLWNISMKNLLTEA